MPTVTCHSSARGIVYCGVIVALLWTGGCAVSTHRTANVPYSGPSVCGYCGMTTSQGCMCFSGNHGHFATQWRPWSGYAEPTPNCGDVVFTMDTVEEGTAQAPVEQPPRPPAASFPPVESAQQPKVDAPRLVVPSVRPAEPPHVEVDEPAKEKNTSEPTTVAPSGVSAEPPSKPVEPADRETDDAPAPSESEDSTSESEDNTGESHDNADESQGSIDVPLGQIPPSIYLDPSTDDPRKPAERRLATQGHRPLGPDSLTSSAAARIEASPEGEVHVTGSPPQRIGTADVDSEGAFSPSETTTIRPSSSAVHLKLVARKSATRSDPPTGDASPPRVDGEIDRPNVWFAPRAQASLEQVEDKSSTPSPLAKSPLLSHGEVVEALRTIVRPPRPTSPAGRSVRVAAALPKQRRERPRSTAPGGAIRRAGPLQPQRDVPHAGELPVSETRFLQYDSVTIVISRGYGDAIAVWHQALGGCQTPSLFGAN